MRLFCLKWSMSPTTVTVPGGVCAADVLIINEISMISERTLLLVESVARHIRGKPLPFGGLQVCESNLWTRYMTIPKFVFQYWCSLVRCHNKTWSRRCWQWHEKLTSRKQIPVWQIACLAAHDFVAISYDSSHCYVACVHVRWMLCTTLFQHQTPL